MLDTKRSWRYLGMQPSNVVSVGKVILNVAYILRMMNGFVGLFI